MSFASFVSLFTREWIEIMRSRFCCTASNCLPLYEGVDWNSKYIHRKKTNHPSPSLRGSGLKCWQNRLHQTNSASPSLRGSGLKCGSVCMRFFVCVSLFTREWIEILFAEWQSLFPRSPSLRGSGLKWEPFLQDQWANHVSLFTREWIEMAESIHNPLISLFVSLFTREWIEIILRKSMTSSLGSPSLRGSGLKFRQEGQYQSGTCRLPLYEGVDWNLESDVVTDDKDWVSLFTREWIEIDTGVSCCCFFPCLPLYEGVDWNPVNHALCIGYVVSLFTREWIEIIATRLLKKVEIVSLFTREWIEIFCWTNANKCEQKSPSLRGSGLKWCWGVEMDLCNVSLPLYEGVDWNRMVTMKP